MSEKTLTAAHGGVWRSGYSGLDPRVFEVVGADPIYPILTSTVAG